MQILSLHIREFGGLRDRTVTLSDGLNLISGDNESGKSTLIAFIRFMLYGLPRRVAGEELSDADRAYSWENGVADGSLTLAYRGNTYRIERREQDSSPRKLLQIIDETTGQPLPKGETPESLFLGFPMQVFDSTCCIRQLRASQLSGDGLSGAIENLLLSGDESVSADKAADALERARKTLLHKNGKGGEIYRAKAEIAALSARLTQLRTDAETLKEMKRRKAETEQRILSAQRAVEQAEEDSRIAADARLLVRFDALRKEEERLRRQETLTETLREEQEHRGIRGGAAARTLEHDAEELENDERTRIRAEAELRVARQASGGDEHLLRTAEAIRESGGIDAVLGELRALAAKRRTAALLPSLLLASAAFSVLAFAVLALLLAQPILTPVGIGVAVLLAAVGIASLKKKKRAARALTDFLAHFGIPEREKDPETAFAALASRAFREWEHARANEDRIAAAENALKAADDGAQTRKREIAQKHGALLSRNEEITPTLLRSTAASLRTRENELTRAEDSLAMLREQHRRSAEALGRCDESALRRSLPKDYETYAASDTEEYRDAVSQRKAHLSALEAENLDLTRRLSALEAIAVSPEETLREIEEKTAACAHLEAKHRAILLAETAIAEARAGLKSHVSPRLREDASMYLGALSSGKYGTVTFDGDFALSADADGRIRPATAFSGGTRDAMYLSLRLALTDLLSGTKGALPLLLDEALSQLDDGRARALLAILLRRAENGGQTLLFTCHTREIEILKDEKVHIVKL